MVFCEHSSDKLHDFGFGGNGSHGPDPSGERLRGTGVGRSGRVYQESVRHDANTDRVFTYRHWMLAFCVVVICGFVREV